MEYPSRLIDCECLSFDIETKDPLLLDKGPGVYRKDGYVLGVAISDGDFAEYYDLGHEGLDPATKESNLKFLEDVLKSPSKKLGTNILYDLDWIENFLGLKVNGQLLDIQIAEPLINENQFHFSLEAQANKYLKEGKEVGGIEEYCRVRGWKGKPQGHLWRMPYEEVRGYAKMDVLQPFRIFWDHQVPLLEEMNLTDLFNIESGLTRLLLQMRKQGVRVDTEKLSIAREHFLKLWEEAQYQLNHITGKKIEVNYNSANELAFVCDKLGLDYPRTEKTNKPSFVKQWLNNHSETHPLFGLINKCRKFDRIVHTFIDNSIEGMLVGDRIHCQFNQLKRDEGGTVSGRFSSSKPNLQQIPANDPDVGKAIRQLFVPEVDHDWLRYDYSQVEMRIIAHYAVGEGSDAIREQFIKDPRGTDYHQWCADEAGIPRKKAKTINFGVNYGMGLDLLCKNLNLTYAEGKDFMDMYNTKLPFVKETIQAANKKAKKRGYVFTILKRRRRFPGGKGTYKAFNSVVQGSAADVMKKAMKDAFDAGIFNTLLPHLTVHDEMDVSKPRTRAGDEAMRELKYIMENCVQLKVPLVVDPEIGPNWGELKEIE
jgi:DNA polymerase-1